MLFIFMVCTAFAIICYRYNPKSEAIRWFCLVLILGAMAGLSRVIIESIIPTLKDFNADFPIVTESLHYIRIFTGFVSVYFYPWAILMFSITYYGQFSKRMKKILTYFLLIPIPFMFKPTVFSPDIQPDFRALFYWAVPYLLTSCVLLVLSYLREKDSDRKKERCTTLMIGLPAILSILIFNYVLRAYQAPQSYWRYVALFIGISFLVFLKRAFLDGAFGFKITYEGKPKAKVIKAVTSGTALLNHTLKNEVSKISISAENIKSSKYGNECEIKDSLQTISNAADHISAMMTRIQAQMQEFILCLKEEELTIIVDKTIEAFQPLIHQKEITISKSYTIKPIIYCDPVHVQEVISNLMINSIEAINKHGFIKIDIRKSSDMITLAISDNGQGIPEEYQADVLTPFFSTKKHDGHNFGLGLAYCDQVMQKHMGKLEIESHKDSGTTVHLQFPCKRLKRGQK